MKAMLQTLNEQAEREKAAVSYIDNLFKNISNKTQTNEAKQLLSKNEMHKEAEAKVISRLTSEII